MATTSEAEQQDANIQPPRRGQVIAQDVSATAFPIDMTKLAFNGQTWNGAQQEFLYLTLVNESATTTIYYYFQPAATPLTGDPAVINTAATQPAFVDTSMWPLLPLQKESIRLRRDVDKFMVVRTASGNATLRLTSSSGSTAQQQ